MALALQSFTLRGIITKIIFPGSDEIANSVKTIVKGVQEKQISSHDIDVKLISQCMYSNDTPDPDIIVRTSGEIRLSDFLLWQVRFTYL